MVKAHAICHTCGVQHDAAAERPPEVCAICADARQWVPQDGQRWTTMEALRATHVNAVRRDGDLVGIGSEPRWWSRARSATCCGSA